MQVFGPPTMDAASFAAVLQAARSPVLRERPAAEYYSLCVANGLDPAFALAIANREHGYGTNPAAVVVRYGLKNWSDTRTRRKAALGGYSVSTDRGNFWAYDSWLASLDDLCYRLKDPTYAYAGKTTVEEIVPIMAPPGDMDNDPAAYVNAVLALMRGWATPQKGTMQFADRTALIPHAPASAPVDNRDGRRLLPLHAFVVHETDNENPGTGAESTRRWLLATNSNNQIDSWARPEASFHFAVDGTESVQLLPAGPNDAEIGWHIGDGVDNAADEGEHTIGGEICVNSDGNYVVACARMAKVAARVLFAHGLQVIDGVTLRQHGSYYSAANPTVHQGCPKHLKARNGAGDWGVSWAQMVDMVKAEYANLQGVKKVPVDVLPKVQPADPGFPGALQPNGHTVLNGVDFDGEAVCVEEVTTQVRNAKGERYRRTWAGYSLSPWVKV